MDIIRIALIGYGNVGKAFTHVSAIPQLGMLMHRMTDAALAKIDRNGKDKRIIPTQTIASVVFLRFSKHMTVQTN